MDKYIWTLNIDLTKDLYNRLKLDVMNIGYMENVLSLKQLFLHRVCLKSRFA